MPTQNRANLNSSKILRAKYYIGSIKALTKINVYKAYMDNIFVLSWHLFGFTLK